MMRASSEKEFDLDEMSRLARISHDIFPNGSNGEFNLAREDAAVIVKGQGCTLWDTRNKEYIDCSLAFGSVLLGHANAMIGQAITKTLSYGENFGGLNLELIRLGERLIKISRAAHKLRFCASGTEAMMYCMRLARAWTRRPLLVKFEGAYHGATDIGCASLTVGDAKSLPAPRRLDAGSSHVLDSELLVAPFNDADFVDDLFKLNKGRIAGILVEPLHRCIPPAPGFFQALRNIADQNNALLIFDEVVTGFRLALGGAQEVFNVVPDLVGYGKALGNGYPIAVVAGRGEIIDFLGEDRFGTDEYVWSVSTGGGNIICAAAANAALDQYQAPGFYEGLNNISKTLADGFQSIFARYGVPAQVLGYGPLLQIVLHDRQVRCSADLFHDKASLEHALMVELYRTGVYVNPMGTKIYLSAVHGVAECDVIIDKTDSAFKKILEHFQ